MRALIFVVALFAIWSSTMAIDVNLCTIAAGTGVFYLCPFTQIDPPVVNYTSDLILPNELIFSFITNKVQGCDPGHAVYGVHYNANNECKEIADEDPSYTLINDADPNQGLVITYPNVTKGNANHTLIVQLSCDVDITDAKSTSFAVDVNTTPVNLTFNNYIYTVTGSSKYGCPVFALDKIINFLQSNRTIFAAVLGVIGVVLTFLGLKFFKFAVFVITTVLGTLLTGSIFFLFTDIGSQAWVLWAVFGVSIALGIALGIVAVKLEKVGFFCVGAGLGVVGGLMLYNGIILPIMKSGSGTAPLYIVVIICAIVGGIFAFFVFETILIIATSLIGSYIVVRVISIFAGGFPNEAYVAEGLKNFDAITYAYLAGIVVLAIVGMFVQFKTKSSAEKDEERAPNGNYAYYRY